MLERTEDAQGCDEAALERGRRDDARADCDVVVSKEGVDPHTICVANDARTGEGTVWWRSGMAVCFRGSESAVQSAHGVRALTYSQHMG